MIGRHQGGTTERGKATGKTVALAAAVGVLTLTGLACASGGPRPGEDARELLRLAGGRDPNPPRDGSELFRVDTVDAPAERTFGAARDAYSALDIPFSYFDEQGLRLGGFVRELDELDGDAPSTFMDCGRGATAEQYADVYNVSMAIGTRVRSLDASTSTVETVIRARARARDVSSNLIRCSSFGTLEERIARLVEDEVG
ncbi:MAG: hypothetical protein U5R14_14980 [Gemmatimonadota bacterium]|nr:hypothetical protein [Gemmatimonadota bacterium]